MSRVTKAQKQAFLDCLGESGSIAEACRAAGFARRTANRLRERDPEFERACARALVRGLEVLRDEAIERARRGWTVPVYSYGKRVGEVRRYSDALTIHLLKLIPPPETSGRWPVEAGEAPGLREVLTEINGRSRGIEGLGSRKSGVGSRKSEVSGRLKGHEANGHGG